MNESHSACSRRTSTYAEYCITGVVVVAAYLRAGWMDHLHQWDFGGAATAREDLRCALEASSVGEEDHVTALPALTVLVTSMATGAQWVHLLRVWWEALRLSDHPLGWWAREDRWGPHLIWGKVHRLSEGLPVCLHPIWWVNIAK